MNLEIIGLITTISLALLGYLITYFNDRNIHKREESLKLVNQRIEKFYGPLYFSTIAGKTAYGMLLTKLGRNHVNENPTKEDLEEWRNWVINIFMPNNRKQREIIYNNAYLIVDSETPECLVNFVKHLSELETITKKWDQGDYSEHFPISDYPEKLEAYIEGTYKTLKNQQMSLIRNKN